MVEGLGFRVQGASGCHQPLMFTASPQLAVVSETERKMEGGREGGREEE
jgi:hypothetical protein